MTNLLNSTDIATVFLDDELCITRFTPQARAIFQLIQTDIGRPITDLASQLKYLQFENDAKEVIRTLVPRKLELRTESGAYYLTRMMPYRTSDNRLNGLVVTFVDTTAVQGARTLARSVAEVVEVPLMILNGVEFQTILPRRGSVTMSFNAQRLEYPTQFVLSFFLEDGSPQ